MESPYVCVNRVTWQGIVLGTSVRARILRGKRSGVSKKLRFTKTDVSVQSLSFTSLGYKVLFPSLPCTSISQQTQNSLNQSEEAQRGHCLHWRPDYLIFGELHPLHRLWLRFSFYAFSQQAKVIISASVTSGRHCFTQIK